MLHSRVFFLSGWTAAWDTNWLYAVHLKAFIEAKGIEFIPISLVTDNDKIQVYVDNLHSIIGKPNERDVFITQSIGGQLALRYLASLCPEDKFGGVFSIAGWFNLNAAVFGGSLPTTLEQWCDTSTLDLQRVKSVCTKFVLLISDDDPYCDVPQQCSRWTDLIGATSIVRSGRGHYLNPVKEPTEGWVLPEEDLSLLSTFLV